MSDTVSGCIQHKDTRYIQVRCDYMGMYQGNEHKAKIIRVLETWTDFKRTEWYKNNLDRIEQGQEISVPDFWITMSHKQFRQFMFGTSSIDTIKSCLDELVKAKHIERRISPDNPYGAPQYLLNYRAIQKGLNKLGAPSFVPELPPQEEVTPPGKPTPPTGVQSPPTLGGELPLPQGGKSATSNNSNSKDLTENKEESVYSEPPTEDTHTSFINSSSQEQVAETTAPTQQARSRAETATSAPAPRTPTSPSVSLTGVRGVSLPQDTNRVEPSVAQDKSQVNKPALTDQELADRRHWAKYVSKDDNITKADALNGLNLHYQWVATYGAYGKAPWCDKALIWIAQQSDGTWENVQKVYDALPETAINPEKVANNWHRLNGKKKASSRDASSSSIPGYTDYTHVKPNKPIRPMPRAERNATPPQKESPR